MSTEQTKLDDGGPAFANAIRGSHPHGTLDLHMRGGMTLLDWFAGQALAGILASAGMEALPSSYDASADAYDYAAAMIADKRKREGGAA